MPKTEKNNNIYTINTHLVPQYGAYPYNIFIKYMCIYKITKQAQSCED